MFEATEIKICGKREPVTEQLCGGIEAVTPILYPGTGESSAVCRYGTLNLYKELLPHYTLC